jgi:hypothetical protein
VKAQLARRAGKRVCLKGDARTPYSTVAKVLDALLVHAVDVCRVAAAKVFLVWLPNGFFTTTYLLDDDIGGGFQTRLLLIVKDYMGRDTRRASAPKFLFLRLPCLFFS